VRHVTLHDLHQRVSSLGKSPENHIDPLLTVPSLKHRRETLQSREYVEPMDHTPALLKHSPAPQTAQSCNTSQGRTSISYNIPSIRPAPMPLPYYTKGDCFQLSGTTAQATTDYEAKTRTTLVSQASRNIPLPQGLVAVVTYTPASSGLVMCVIMQRARLSTLHGLAPVAQNYVGIRFVFSFCFLGERVSRDGHLLSRLTFRTGIVVSPSISPMTMRISRLWKMCTFSPTRMRKLHVHLLDETPLWQFKHRLIMCGVILRNTWLGGGGSSSGR
jgi:hypothetical protein